MKVRTLKPHGNCFGDSFDKAVGDEYDNSKPKADLLLGNVELCDAGEDKVTGNARDRKETGAVEISNGKKQGAKDIKRGGGAGRTDGKGVSAD